jgi:hypothetical protein
MMETLLGSLVFAAFLLAQVTAVIAIQAGRDARVIGDSPT